MKSLKNLRDAIIRAHERGKKQVEIAEFLGISTSTVNDAIKRYKETGNNEDRKGREEVERKLQEAERTSSALKE